MTTTGVDCFIENILICVMYNWYTFLNHCLTYSSEKLMCTLNLDMFVLNGTEGGFKGVHYYYYRFILFTKIVDYNSAFKSLCRNQ